DIVPRDNVIIRLCSIEADFGKTFDEPSNEDFYTNIENWSKITKNLYIWDYIVDFSNYVLLHPNFHVLQKNLQIMRDHNAVAVFEQGDSFNSNGCFHNYKRYITAKLLWNPDLDMEKETISFMKAYYGPAWNEMYNFIKYANSVVAETPVKVATYMFDNNYFSTEDWIKLFAYLNNAEKKVRNSHKYYDRVRMDMMCFYAGVLSTNKEVGNTLSEKNLLPFSDFLAGAEAVNQFIPAHGLTYFGEGIPWESGAYAMSVKNEKKGSVPEECKNLKNEDWIDIQDENISYAGVIFEKEPYRKIIDDSTASDGKALKIDPKSIEWYIQEKIGYLYFDKSIKSADFYIVAKIEKGSKEGKAIECGVWSSVSGNCFTAFLGAEDTPNNEWQTIKLGSADFEKINGGAYFYICGKGDENMSPNVLIDRIFIIIKR
ncbi:MAG: DUF4838 domain-containing protein, partial [Armatimonadetes bacterium]|nr:DUF4838 domain-containing protein [Candidatus Hippobium faecium]